MRDIDRVASSKGGGWDWYREGGRNVVKEEIDAAGSPYEQTMIRAELRRLMRAAVEGRLDPREEVKPLRLRPGLYELRLRTATRLVWRLYFAWKGHLGPLRVALKFGGKARSERGRETQDRHIVEARDRHDAWQRANTR